eukprot:g9618.t1
MRSSAGPIVGIYDGRDSRDDGVAAAPYNRMGSSTMHSINPAGCVELAMAAKAVWAGAGGNVQAAEPHLQVCRPGAGIAAFACCSGAAPPPLAMPSDLCEGPSK